MIGFLAFLGNFILWNLRLRGLYEIAVEIGGAGIDLRVGIGSAVGEEAVGIGVGIEIEGEVGLGFGVGECAEQGHVWRGNLFHSLSSIEEDVHYNNYFDYFYLYFYYDYNSCS